MLGGTQIQFPLGRGRWSHKEQGNKVETFLQLILPVIVYCHFCFAFLIQKLDAHPCLPLWNPVSWQIFTQEIKGAILLFQNEAWNETLTLDIEGGVGGVEYLSRGRVFHDALKVPCVQLTIHRRELEVAALLEEPLAVLQALAVVEPAVADVGRIADLAA